MQLIPLAASSRRLTAAEAVARVGSLAGWTLAGQGDELQLWREYRTADFASAFALAGRVAALADRHDHHPRLTIRWGGLEVRWWTHALRGLHENDFLMAAETDATIATGVPGAGS